MKFRNPPTKRPNLAHQRGFTLVETGVVLVIVGLLLGTAFKGQELINSARVKDLTRDFSATAVHVVAYQDRFRALPGDDPRVAANVGGSQPSTPAGSVLFNGLIEGAWNSRTTTDESYLFWEHLRRANLTGGSTDIANVETYVPRNAEGGRIGVTSQLAGGGTGSYFVCSANIIGRFARQIDLQLDDGDTTTGAVRVFTNDDNNAGPTTPVLANLTAISDASLYSVCVAN